jgi:cytochrome bd ubiquinol oxidase subunit I
MPDLLAARAQMGTSLAFHIVFAALGVGLPLLFCIAEGFALWRKDDILMTLTRRWVKASAVLFAVGAVSGTILSFELGLLWPTFTEYSGSVIGLPFALEGFAFFLEAIFFGLYLYGWQRLSPLAHWLCSFPIWIGGLLSAWFVVTANAWMNTPAGFEIQNGEVVGINPIAAMLNPSTPYQTAHMIFACYVATGFGVAAVYAVSMLRGKRDEYRRKGLLLGMLMGSIALPFQLLSGHACAVFLAQAQPVKLAAMEGHFQTEAGAPLRIGGWADPATGQVHYAFEIPKGLSILAHNDPDATVRGLDQFSRADWPNVPLVHLSFDGMVGIGLLALLIGGTFWLLYFKRKRSLPEHRWMLRAIGCLGPLAFLAIELGWMVTELGRQPWVIYGVLRTEDAVTPSTGLDISFLVFSLIYLLLAITLIWLLRNLSRIPLPIQDQPKKTLDQHDFEKVGV